MATDIEYDIEVSKDKSTVKLTLSVPPRIKARDPIIEIKEHNAIQILDDKGLRGYRRIDDGNAGRLSNWDDRSRSAVWVFSNKEVPTKAAVTETPSAEQPAPKATVAKGRTTKKSRPTASKKRRTTVTTKES